MQAFAGLMSVTGEEGRPPVRVGTAIIDMSTGMWLVIGVISALLARAKTGQGCMVGTSLYESALAWMGHHAADYQASLKVPQRQGSEVAQVVPSKVYATIDGFIMIAVGNDKLFALFARPKLYAVVALGNARRTDFRLRWSTSLELDQF
jgi:crotonobetainyl-CoA:carnitine CoA-transferase CaiB-like acyl-CoA transferase